MSRKYDGVYNVSTEAVIHRNGFHANIAKFTRKYLCRSIFFACNFLKKRLWPWCFSVNFAKFSRKAILYNISERLFLSQSVMRYYWERTTSMFMKQHMLHIAFTALYIPSEKAKQKTKKNNEEQTDIHWYSLYRWFSMLKSGSHIPPKNVLFASIKAF